MLIATLCGSLQPASANEAVLAVVERSLRARGVTVRRIEGLDGLPPFRPDVDVPSEVAEWSGGLADVDGVVIATPEYAAGPPGVLKNGLDWMVGLSTLYRTPTVVICAGSTGGAFTIEALVRTLSYQGALTVGTLGIAAARTKLDAAGEVTDPATKDHLEVLSAVLERACRAGEPELRALVAPVVAPHGVDVDRFGLASE